MSLNTFINPNSIQYGSITAEHISDGSITTNHIADGSINRTHIANDDILAPFIVNWDENYNLDSFNSKGIYIISGIKVDGDNIPNINVGDKMCAMLNVMNNNDGYVSQQLTLLKSESKIVDIKIRIGERISNIIHWTEWVDANSIQLLYYEQVSKIEIYPNKYYNIRGVKSLSVNLNTIELNENLLGMYSFEVSFVGGNTLSLPNNIKWANEITPEICKDGCTYLINITKSGENLLGVIAEFN